LDDDIIQTEYYLSWEIWTKAVKGKNWKAYSNFFISQYEKNQKKKKIRSKPYIMYLDPSSFCNLSCPFCPTGAKIIKREPGRLSLERFNHLMNHCGEYLFELLLYNWGEPLLHTDLPEMIKCAKKFHIMTTVSSNLSIFIDPQKMNEIVDSGLDNLICSIDGASQDTYQKYRVDGNYELVIKNLEMLSKIKKERNSKTPHITWQFLVFKHNQHEIEKAKLIATQLGVTINFVKPFVSDVLHPEKWISTISEYQQDVKLRNRQTKETTIINSTTPHTKLSPTEDKPCSWLWSAIAVSPIYSVSPCCGIADEINDFGKIKDSFFDFWNNDKYQSARDYFKTGKNRTDVICHRCPIPDIQQSIRNNDVQIFSYLYTKSGSFTKSLLRFLLRRIDPELYQKTLDLFKQ